MAQLTTECYFSFKNMKLRKEFSVVMFSIFLNGKYLNRVKPTTMTIKFHRNVTSSIIISFRTLSSAHAHSWRNAAAEISVRF